MLSTTDTKDPVISAIMPVYNCAPYIRDAVESVLNQSHGDFELLIMDDASIDGTLEAINDIKDGRVIIHKSEKNIGQASQMNKGIQLSRGKFIAVINGDDINDSLRFALQLEVLEQQPVSVVGSWIEYFGNRTGIWKTPVTSEECFAGMFEEMPVAHPTLMVKKESLLKAGVLYQPGMVLAEDYDLLIRLSTSCKFYNIPKPLVKYRIHDTNISSTKASLLQSSKRQVRENMVQLHLKDLEKESVELFWKLWNFEAGSFISREMINSINKLPQKLEGRGGVGKKIWKELFQRWLFNNMIITKNYEFGVGFYYLWKWPKALFRNKGLDVLKILVRSIHA
jgi:glycosyltransferase involved in cell wall biosynthesis